MTQTDSRSRRAGTRRCSSSTQRSRIGHASCGPGPPRGGTAPSARGAPGSRSPRPCRRRARRASLRRLRRLDREAVVLARDENMAGPAVEHRMVRAAVAERKLERLVAGREPQELVAEADPEDRVSPRRPRTTSTSASQRLGVARAVREDDAVEAASSSGCARVREDRHGRAGGAGGAAIERLSRSRRAATRTVADLARRRTAPSSRRPRRALALHRRLRAYMLEGLRPASSAASATATARIAPPARSRSTSARVSISSSATIPCAFSQAAHSRRRGGASARPSRAGGRLPALSSTP